MLKKHGQLYFSSLFFSDTLAIVLAWFLAYTIRFKFQFFPLVHGIPDSTIYQIALIPIWVVFLINVKIFDLYQPLQGKSRLTQYFTIIKVTIVSVLMLTALTFFYRDGSFSRIVVVYFWFLVTILMILSHWIARRLLLAARERGYRLQNVLIAGDGELGQLVVDKINLHPEIGFSIVGYLTGEKENVGISRGDYKVLGEYKDLSRLIKENDVDQLFIALSMKEHDRLENVLAFLEKETVDVKVVPDLLRYMNIQSGVEELDGMPIVNLAESPLYGWNVIVKRLSDVVLSSLAILAASPIMLLVLILIKLESKGPVFYRQERMGLDQNVFSMLKFRSMKVDAEDQSGPVWARENDDRRTRLGTFLRSTSLDELPQLFNVFIGDMSLVGPRPERPVFIDEFKQSIPNYMLRLKMKAGLTGWAQVNGWRGNTSLERRIECDLYYIKNWSMLFDIKIIFMTVWKGFVNRHAY